MGAEIIKVRGVKWSVWQTSTGTWKGWARFLDDDREIHRAHKDKLLEEIEDHTRLWVGTGSVEQWGGIAAWQEWQSCKAIGERCGVTVLQMCQAYERLNPSGIVEMPLTDARAAWLKAKASLAKPWLEQHAATLAQLCKAMPKMTCNAVGGDDIAALLSGASGRTWGHKAGILRTFFAHAKAMRWCAGNPCDGLKRPDAVAGNAEISVMSPDQLTALFAVAEDAVERRYIALSAWTGARQSEILRLQADDVHRASGVIVLAAPKTKTRQRRIVPMLGKVKAYLPKTGALFSSDWKPERLWIAGRAVLGGTWPRNVLRHSQISYRLAMLKGDVNTVAMESGNSPDMIFRHYRGVRTLDGQLVTPKLARAWF